MKLEDSLKSEPPHSKLHLSNGKSITLMKSALESNSKAIIGQDSFVFEIQEKEASHSDESKVDIDDPLAISSDTIITEGKVSSVLENQENSSCHAEDAKVGVVG